MSEEKSKWEKVTNLPNEYEEDPTVAQRAIETIERAQNQPKRGWFSLHWKRFTAVAASLVTVFIAIGLVFLPKLLSSPEEKTPSIVYYADETLRFDDLTDVPVFVREKNLPIKYFSLANTTSKAAIISEAETFAYLQQQTVYIDVATASFDKLQLRAVVLQNATFDFEEDYEKPTETVTCTDITVSYAVKQNAANEGQVKIFASFSKDEITYYLEIQTAGEAAAKIERYVAMLMA